MNTHAITPTDNRRPVLHDCSPRYQPEASREHSANTMNLALTIADGAVRSDVECYADPCSIEGTDWLNTAVAVAAGKYTPDDLVIWQGYVDRAVRYIGLRHPDAFPWRFIRHPELPHLVRFEDKP